MRSGYNGATVQAVEYTGEATGLSWELQHSLCAAAGRATPGSDLSARFATGPTRSDGTYENQDKSCAYSAADTHVVADDCAWYWQEFTHVSGTLGGGVGWMCAGWGGIDCREPSCDGGCSPHGTCVRGKCFCQHGWSGPVSYTHLTLPTILRV